jgi:hypothetical protein
MMLRTVLCCAIFLVAGCATERTVMVNRQGEELTCETNGAGLFGAVSVHHQQQQCISDAEKRGYSVKN